MQAPDRASGVELVQPVALNPQLSTRTNDAIVWALQTNVKDRPQLVRAFLDSLTVKLAVDELPAMTAGPEPPSNAWKSDAEDARYSLPYDMPAMPTVDVTVPSPAKTIAQMQLQREQEFDGGPLKVPLLPRKWFVSNDIRGALVVTTLIVFALLAVSVFMSR
jgi:hypothetical protein